MKDAESTRKRIITATPLSAEAVAFLIKTARV